MKNAFVLGVIFATAVAGGRDRIAVEAVAASDPEASVVANLRKALGGNEKLESIHTFRAEGSYRRLFGSRQFEGTLELTVQRPDKMRRIEELQMSDMAAGPALERVMTLNGTRGWDQSNQRGGHGPGGGRMMLHMGPGPGGPGGSGAPGSSGGEPPTPEQMEERRGRLLKQELDRWMFALLALSAQEIAHVGTAQAPDGVAEVLEIKDDRGEPVRLFVDQQTHLPLMLTFQTVRPRVMTARGSGGPGGQRPDPEALRRQMEAEGPPPPATATLRFADYKAVSGVMLPHRVEQSIDDDPTEEWVIDKFRLNPSVKPDLFERK